MPGVFQDWHVLTVSDGMTVQNRTRRDVVTSIKLSFGRRVDLLNPDSSQGGSFENLCCVDARGKLIWRAPLPSENDTFVALEGSENLIIATTWSGYRITIDPESGIVKSTEFVK